MPHRTRIAAYALLVDGGKILLCRLAGTELEWGRWTLPGGGLEFGEHPEHAARREVLEETGYDVDLGELLLLESEVLGDPENPLHAIRFIYRARIVGGELTHEVEGSTDIAEWVEFAEARKLPLVPLAQTGLRLAQQIAGGPTPSR